MANYEDNRIRCSKATAEALITSDSDKYFKPIDFRKALGMEPSTKIEYDLYYGYECTIFALEDGRVDIGFCTRWYSNIDIIRAFIKKYPDAEWWVNQDDVDIFHYYWLDGEVIEDTHHLTDEETEYLSSLLDKYSDIGDESDHFDMIFTEKEDQSKYINFHPKKESEEYKGYLSLVNCIAKKIIDENKFYALKKYDYHWEGAYRHYETCMAIRALYLYKASEDLSNYKLNIMSEDILNKLQNLIYPYNKQLYDAIFGFAIGDALGVPYEFQERGSFLCTDLTGYGCHHQPAGTWSDDTSMTLATLKSLKDNNGKINIEDIRKRFLSWLRENAFTANGEVFDIGHATYEALTSGKPCEGERSNGNGSLMRILPLAFVECTDEEIRAVSAITHGHWISEEACVIYVHVAKRLLTGENILDILPTLQYDKPFDRLHRIHQLDISEIKSSGYVVDTLEAALWAISHVEENDKSTGSVIKDYANDVLAAVNLGEDTDTVAAVAGGLSAIIHGLGYKGEQWLERLRNKELILECLW